MILDSSNNLSINGTNGTLGFVLNPNIGQLSLSGSNSGIVLNSPNAGILMKGSAAGITLSGNNSTISLTGTNSAIKLSDGTVISNSYSLRGAGLYQVGSTNPYATISTNGIVKITGNGVQFSGTNGTSGLTINPTNGSITVSGSNSGIILSSVGSKISLTGSNSAITLSDGTAISNSASLRSSVLYQAGSTNIYESRESNGVVRIVGSGLAVGIHNKTTGSNSTALGLGTVANSYNSIAIGQYNVGLVNTNNGTNSWITSDPILEIGNGTNAVTPSNAVTIFKNGNIRTIGKIESKAGIRIAPQGDLSMGIYTNGSNPSTMIPSSGLLYPNGK